MCLCLSVCLAAERADCAAQGERGCMQQNGLFSVLLFA